MGQKNDPVVAAPLSKRSQQLKQPLADTFSPGPTRGIGQEAVATLREHAPTVGPKLMIDQVPSNMHCIVEAFAHQEREHESEQPSEQHCDVKVRREKLIGSMLQF